MYERNHYFGLGPIPKPKLKLGYFLNQICCQTLNIFRLFFKNCVQFQAFKYLYPPKKQKNMRKFENLVAVLGKKNRLRYRYRNWTFVSVPDTETWFPSHEMDVTRDSR